MGRERRERTGEEKEGEKGNKGKRRLAYEEIRSSGAAAVYGAATEDHDLSQGTV